MASAPLFEYPDFKYPKSVAKYASLAPDKVLKRLQLEKAVGSFIIIARKPKPSLLITKRSEKERSFPGRYDCPGGAIELWDPSIAHGPVREVFKETGLVIDHINGFVVFQPFKHKDKNTVYPPKVKPSDEDSTYMWCNFEDIPAQRPLITNEIQYMAIQLGIMILNNNNQGYSETNYFNVKASKV